MCKTSDLGKGYTGDGTTGCPNECLGIPVTKGLCWLISNFRHFKGTARRVGLAVPPLIVDLELDYDIGLKAEPISLGQSNIYIIIQFLRFKGRET